MNSTNPVELLIAFRDQRPLTSAAAMTMLDYEWSFLSKLSEEIDGMGEPMDRSGISTIWIIGNRGCGKSQAELVLKQILETKAYLEKTKVLFVKLNAKEIGTKSVEQLILKDYLTDTLDQDVQYDHEYKKLLSRTQELRDQAQEFSQQIFNLGFKLLESYLPTQALSTVFKKTSGMFFNSRWFLKVNFRNSLVREKDNNGNPKFTKEEINFLVEWYKYISSPSKETLDQFQSYTKFIDSSLRRILFSLIKKAGITSIVMQLDEADDFAQATSPLRTNFEKHWDNLGNELGLKFYHTFCTLPKSIDILFNHEHEWGFTRRYLGFKNDQKPSIIKWVLKDPVLEKEMIAHHLNELAMLHLLSGESIRSFRDDDIIEVLARLKDNNMQGIPVSWAKYWATLIGFMETSTINSSRLATDRLGTISVLRR